MTVEKLRAKIYEEWKKDRRLIAKAPTLLEAYKKEHFKDGQVHPKECAGCTLISEIESDECSCSMCIDMLKKSEAAS